MFWQLSASPSRPGQIPVHLWSNKVGKEKVEGEQMRGRGGGRGDDGGRRGIKMERGVGRGEAGEKETGGNHLL